MALSPRSFTLLGGLLGGSCGLAPLLTWRSSDTSAKLAENKSQDLSTPAKPSPINPSLTLPAPSDPVEVVEKPEFVAPQAKAREGNCKYIEIKYGDELEDLLWNKLGQSSTGYKAFECDDSGQNWDGIISNNWTGLFPEPLVFIGGSRSGEINMSVKDNNVTFTGNVFTEPLATEQWVEQDIQDVDKTVKKVNIKSTKTTDPIYIVFKSQLQT